MSLKSDLTKSLASEPFHTRSVLPINTTNKSLNSIKQRSVYFADAGLKEVILLTEPCSTFYIQLHYICVLVRRLF